MCIHLCHTFDMSQWWIWGHEPTFLGIHSFEYPMIEKSNPGASQWIFSCVHLLTMIHYAQNCVASEMADDHSWIYSGWDKGKTTQMSGWTRPHHFWTVLSRRHRLCGAHVAYARIWGAWRTSGPLSYMMRGWFLIFREVEVSRSVEISTLMKKALNRWS
jgi:hypothetical protein